MTEPTLRSLFAQPAPIPGLVPKMGLLPDDPTRPRLMLDLAKALALTPYAPSIDWTKFLTVPIGWFGNNRVGDCVLAGIIHSAILSWCVANPGQVPPYVPTDQEVIDLYFKLTGGADTGLGIQTTLDYVRKNGIFGYHLGMFAQVGATGSAIAAQAGTAFLVDLVTGCYVAAHQEYPVTHWTYIPIGQPGGENIGGHCVTTCLIVPGETGMETWAMVVDVDADVIAHQFSQFWWLGWTDWNGQPIGKLKLLPGETAADLAANFHELTGETIPPDLLPGDAMVPFAVTGPAYTGATLTPGDTAIRLIRLSDGALITPSSRTYLAYLAGTLGGAHPGPAHLVVQGGDLCALLDRNATFQPAPAPVSSVEITATVGQSTASATWK